MVLVIVKMELVTICAELVTPELVLVATDINTTASFSFSLF